MVSLSLPLSLNAGQKKALHAPTEHSAILLTCVKLPFVIKIFVLFIFEWTLTTGFTVSKTPPCGSYSSKSQFKQRNHKNKSETLSQMRSTIARTYNI